MGGMEKQRKEKEQYRKERYCEFPPGLVCLQSCSRVFLGHFVYNFVRTIDTIIIRPEATGVIGASIYILLLSLFAPLPYLSHLLPPTIISTTTTSAVISGMATSIAFPFPHHNFATYLASLLSLLTATFLGFLDDVFDIRWRWKVPIPGEFLATFSYWNKRTDSRTWIVS